MFDSATSFFIFFVIWCSAIGVFAFFRLRKTKKILGDGYENLIAAIRESGGSGDELHEYIQNIKPPVEKEKRAPLTDEEKIALMEEEIERLRNKKWQAPGTQDE